HGVGAADLGGDGGGEFYAGRVLDRPHGAEAFGAFLELFVADERRTDAADLADPGVVGQRIERQHAHARALAQQLAGAQHADIRAATAARAEQRSTDGERP